MGVMLIDNPLLGMAKMAINEVTQNGIVPGALPGSSAPIAPAPSSPAPVVTSPVGGPSGGNSGASVAGTPSNSSPGGAQIQSAPPGAKGAFNTGTGLKGPRPPSIKKSSLILPMTKSSALTFPSMPVPNQKNIAQHLNDAAKEHAGLLGLSGVGLLGAGLVQSHLHKEDEDREREKSRLLEMAAQKHHGQAVLPMTASSQAADRPSPMTMAPPVSTKEVGVHGMPGHLAPGEMPVLPPGEMAAGHFEPPPSRTPGVLDVAKEKGIGYLEGLANYTQDTLEANQQPTLRPNDPYTHVPEPRTSFI